jgi:hypothetical protein
MWSNVTIELRDKFEGGQFPHGKIHWNTVTINEDVQIKVYIIILTGGFSSLTKKN